MSPNRLMSLILILAAAVVWPAQLSAQQRANPIIGFLTSGSVASLSKRSMAAFHRGLSEEGLVEGRNVSVDYRGADDNYDRLPALVADFVRNQVSVIVAAGGPVSPLAAKKVTNTIPIVFTTIADPVKSGLVESFSRPGGNVTGTAGLTSELDSKRLELIHEFVPKARRIGVLVNPNRPGVDANSKEMQAAAQTIGCELVFQNAGRESDLDAAFAKFAEMRVDALVVTADPFFNFRRAQVVALAARHAIPAIYQWREFVEDGGLMSYGPSFADAYYQTGLYAGRIVKGAKPADLPVTQPTRFELVMNQKTANTLGVEIPPLMFARADVVTE